MPTKRRVTATLLGPQRLARTLADTLQSLGARGPVATVTAGWQEREEDDDELDDHLGGRSVNLRLYQRAERALGRDPELAEGYRRRQDDLRELQELYRMRLGYALDAVYALLGREGSSPQLAAERSAAIEAVRALDQRHLERVAAIHAGFEGKLRPLERPAVAREREQVAAELERVGAVAIAGGHVAVLLNRLRLFGVGELLGERPVVAWSGGAMVCCERVVLFHDSPPQGSGHAEVLEPGLALVRGVVALPHARRRLRLDDPVRVSLLARRFAPARCIAMDERARVDGRRDRFTVSTARTLTPEGAVLEVE